MNLYPAVDLRGGRVVQLVGGVPGTERVVLEDALATAERWQSAGFRALHVIDLDSALGHGENGELVRRLIATATVPVQVGGGVRTTASVNALLAAGAWRVIVGTRAVLDRRWLERITELWPGRILVAADFREDRVLVRGWALESEVLVGPFLESLAELPLAGVLMTDVRREGRMEGIDHDRFASFVSVSPHALIAAGGVGRIEDVSALERAGVDGVVLGMALYSGALEIAELMEWVR
jgi:phosphoribosylformimino-5-aminoimidazole carboxamide ribotide isomerase